MKNADAMLSINVRTIGRIYVHHLEQCLRIRDRISILRSEELPPNHGGELYTVITAVMSKRAPRARLTTVKPNLTEGAPKLRLDTG